MLYNLKYFILIPTALIAVSCSNPRNHTDIDQALEIICPGVPPTLVLRVSKEDVRRALRRQYSQNKTRETVLKLRDGSNIMIPRVRPRDLDRCMVRSIPKVTIPTSQGY